MSNNTLTTELKKLRKAGWQTWISPLLMLVCAWFLLGFLTSDEPFFLKSFSTADRGKMPEVTFTASKSLWGTVIMFVLFNVFLLQTLRQWARYYLSRKLVLSYLLFAIVPLLTNLFVFTAGITTWLGMSNTFIVEKAIERQVGDLENFTNNLVATLLQSKNLYLNTGQVVNRIRMEKGRGLSHLQAASIPIDVYLIPTKTPGQKTGIVTLYESEPDEDQAGEGGSDGFRNLGMIYSDTREFEAILPTWMDRAEWTDIVNRDDGLAIRHFSFADNPFGTLMVVTAIPIDNHFFTMLKDFQTMRVTLTDKQGRYMSTRQTPPPWYQRLPLRPFASSRDVLALDWNSGKYTEYGTMIFEIEPDEIGRILSHRNKLNIFYGGEQKAALSFIMGITVLMGFGVLIAVIFGIYLISYITRSLNIIAEGHEQIKGGFLGFRLPSIGKDQLGSMGRSFNSMASSIESLMSQVAEKEKYQEELRIARDIQMGLLPDVSRLDWCSNVAAVCIPAREVGGDYYEVLRAGDGMVGLFIADVSGKGTSAAFYMAELKGVLIALRHLWRTPRELLMGMNEILKPALAANVFVSAAYLLVCPLTRTGTLVRAGHCPSFLVHADGEVKELMPPGIAMGIAGNKVFGKIIEEKVFDLGAGDKVILYTDGLDEMTHQQTMYGLEKLKNVLRANSHLNPDELKDAILNDVLGFLDNEEQNDDLTLVVASLPDEEKVNKQLQQAAVGEKGGV